MEHFAIIHQGLYNKFIGFVKIEYFAHRIKRNGNRRWTTRKTVERIHWRCEPVACRTIRLWVWISEENSWRTFGDMSSLSKELSANEIGNDFIRQEIFYLHMLMQRSVVTD